ncbi:hypothetical protein HDV00_012484 [Rhizophlyctis rosea]|nr:hypothetical protein HDV00_012484 [Rhizophlyctis rosea]
MAAQAPAFPRAAMLWEHVKHPFSQKPFPSPDIPATGRPPNFTVRPYLKVRHVPLQTSVLQHTGRATYGYLNDYIHATVTSDKEQANRLFHDTFYDANDNPRFDLAGFDVEQRGGDAYPMPALIQACNPLGEAVAYHCPTVSARQYPEWLLHLVADAAIAKRFIRTDDIVTYHQSAVLDHTLTDLDFGMNDAAQIYLGVPKAPKAKRTGGWENPDLTDKQIDYAITDAQQSMEVVRRVETQLTLAEREEAYEYAAINGHWMCHH